MSSADTRKKYCDSPLKPRVPGPELSAKTLTREKAPDMMPKPRPVTAWGKDVNVMDIENNVGHYVAKSCIKLALRVIETLVISTHLIPAISKSSISISVSYLPYESILLSLNKFVASFSVNFLSTRSALRSIR